LQYKIIIIIIIITKLNLPAFTSFESDIVTLLVCAICNTISKFILIAYHTQTSEVENRL